MAILLVFLVTVSPVPVEQVHQGTEQKQRVRQKGNDVRPVLGPKEIRRNGKEAEQHDSAASAVPRRVIVPIVLMLRGVIAAMLVEHAHDWPPFKVVFSGCPSAALCPHDSALNLDNGAGSPLRSIDCWN
jgi:hypothetical protein